MLRLKGADWFQTRLLIGFRMTKGEKYRGFGIHKELSKGNLWTLSCIEGKGKGIAMAHCRKKSHCKLLADEVIKKLNKVQITQRDVELIRDNLKKYHVREV